MRQLLMNRRWRAPGEHERYRKAMAQPPQKRTERLQIMLSDEELATIDKWRYGNMIPTRAAAIRELLRRGLHTLELDEPVPNAETSEYGVIDDDESSRR